MYATHQRRIGEYARSGPDAFVRVGAFVLATIQQQLSTVPAAMRDLDEVGGRSRFLFGSKRAGWRYLRRRKRTLYRKACALADAGDVDGLVDYLAEIPGLGLVKAGFYAQLAFGVSGCIDSHNAKRFGVRLESFALSGVRRPGTRRAKAEAYNALVQRLGGTESLWDSWCDYVAARQPNTYRDGWYVSALHCEALGLPAEEQLREAA